MGDTTIKYSDQSAETIRFYIVEGELNKSQFNILEEGEFRQQNFFVKAAIIGASHILTFKTNLISINEVAACVSPIEETYTFYGSLSKIRSIDLIFGNLSYKFQAEVKEWQKGLPMLGDIERRIAEKKKDGVYLLFDFPMENNIASAKTLVVVEVINNDVFAETVHSYPNEGKIVFTKTLLIEI